MKNTLLIFVLIISSLSATIAQEFETHPNGLMYSQSTINHLSHIVDSLNLKFKTCDKEGTHFSKKQTVGHFIFIEGAKSKTALDDMKNGISFKKFKHKYADAASPKSLLIKYQNQISVYPQDRAIWFEDLSKQSNNEGWIWEYSEATEYSKERISAVYFSTPFQTYELPEKYVRMIQYADCMIDTSSTNFKGEMDGNATFIPNNFDEMSLIEKKKLLDEFRSTRVVGYCSQDNRPRAHARNIAILAAESLSWEVFLRAHMNIMNDRFERQSDGSYAWGQRKTYLKELEVLDINTLDLLFGTSLQISDASQNHYHGSIGRIGRALSDAKDPAKVESKLIEIIKDDSLDDYNRLVFYFIYTHFTYNSYDKTEEEIVKKKNKRANKFLPEYLHQ